MPHPNIELPIAIIGAIITALCSGAVMVWEWGISLATVDTAAALDPSTLISAIVVLFGSLSGIVVWVGTKFLEASRQQSEASNKVAEALNTFTDRFDGPIMEMFAASVNHAYQHGVDHRTSTLGASPAQRRKAQ